MKALILTLFVLLFSNNTFAQLDTIFTNQQKVKERALKKMKIEAAMRGANLVFLSQINTQGNQLGTEYQAGNTSEASVTGIVYTDNLPKIADFKKLMSNKVVFTVPNKTFFHCTFASYQRDLKTRNSL